MGEARRDVVITLFTERNDGPIHWLVGVSADTDNQEILPHIIQHILPLAIKNGDLQADDGKAIFGIRDADPIIDMELYAKEALEKGRLN